MATVIKCAAWNCANYTRRLNCLILASSSSHWCLLDDPKSEGICVSGSLNVLWGLKRGLLHFGAYWMGCATLS